MNKIISPIIIVYHLFTNIPTIPEYNISLDRNIQEYTYNLCLEHNISYELILSLLWLESNFDTDLVCHNGINNYDSGIAQINNRYMGYHCELVGMDVDSFDPHNPYQAIELCIKLIKYYYNYWLDKGCTPEDATLMALNSYNMGLSGAEKFAVNNGRLDSTYARTVIKHKNNLEQYGEFR